uniref:Retrotransposon Copia-like N-terminal domain-containing protein n=1 Tax=Glycine max TaxID=3847 RepID=A0A0R0JXS9_SOYBN
MTSSSLNISNFITLRLTPTNYPLWREQALALAESQDLTNRLLRGWIIGTLFEEALGLVVGLDTAHVVWTTLKDSYAEDSQEPEFTLRQQITYLRKEDDQSIGEHIHTFKGLCDNLAAIGKPVPNKEKVFYLLTSLGHEYETFATTMLKPPRPSYSELISQLQSHDQRCNWFSNHSNTHNSCIPQVAFYGEQQRSRQFSSQHQRNSQTFTSTGAMVTYMFFPLCQNHIFLIVSNQDQQTFGINV